jgi:hypothetical protein
MQWAICSRGVVIDNKLVVFCLLLSTYCLLFSTKTHAQKARWLLGTGVTYCSYINNGGLNANITYRVIGNLHIGPDFSALLNQEVEENGKKTIRKELEYNFNGQYIFELSEKVGVYPLVGVNWSNVTDHPEGQAPETKLVTALNAGIGLEIKLSKVRLFFESKWVTQLGKYDLTTGILFPL